MSDEKKWVPHDSAGNHQTWTYDDKNDTEAYEFKATLKYVDFERGRSALNIVWEDKKGKKYRSGMKMLDEHLKSGGGNTITGKFGFKKQGTSVLLKLIKE